MDGEKMGLILKKAVLAILIISLAIICIGTVSIPILLVYLYAWQWIFCYPAMLILLAVLAPKKKK